MKLLLVLMLLDTGRPRTNLLEGKWEKFHNTNIADKWGVEAGMEITWFRGAGADGGSAGVYQFLKRDVGRKLRLELEVRIDRHDLAGSGWWSDANGSTGEYPAKIDLWYLDAKEKPKIWSHGFLACDNPQKLRNYVKVPAGEWANVALEIDLGGPSTLTRVYLYGSGWSFQGGMRNVRLTR